MSGFSSVSRVSISAVMLAPDFSNFADYRQLQIPNAQTNYYETVTTSDYFLKTVYISQLVDVAAGANIVSKHYIFHEWSG